MKRDFTDSKYTKKSTPDQSLIKSLLKTAKDDLEFFGEIPLNNKSARKLTSNHYDILRSILEAIASKNGYKIYSHETFTNFLKEKGEITKAEKFDRLRKIRNSINYYGKSISTEEAHENIEEIKTIINYLIGKYLGDEMIKYNTHSDELNNLIKSIL